MYKIIDAEEEEAMSPASQSRRRRTKLKKRILCGAYRITTLCIVREEFKEW